MEALPVIGLSDTDMPALSIEWLEELLNGMLFTDQRMTKDQEFRKNIKSKLTRMEQLSGKKFAYNLQVK